MAPNIGSAPYELFVEDIENLIENSHITDRVLVLGDFNLPKISWLPIDIDSEELSPIGVTTDLEANLVDGLASCDFTQLNSIPNRYDVFLDLIFSNSGSGVVVSTALAPLLKLDRHHWAYDVSVSVDACKFEPVSTDDSKFNFQGQLQRYNR